MVDDGKDGRNRFNLGTGNRFNLETGKSKCVIRDVEYDTMYLSNTPSVGITFI
jgi:hypothetical protein